MDGMINVSKISKMIDGVKPSILMVVVQAILAGANVLMKLASNDGMDLRILIAYRFLFAAAFLLPLAFFVERNKRPKLTGMVIFQAFLCGLFVGTLSQNMYLQSLALTSATFASAISNLAPGFTFLLAIIFRQEQLGWREAAGRAKILGTIMGMSGAMAMTFYEGPQFSFFTTHVDLLHKIHHHGGHVARSHHNMVLGGLYALGSCISCAMWLVVQAKMSQRYPCPYSSSALMTSMAAIQTTILALCMDRNWTQWKLKLDIRLITVVYSGIFASGVIFTLMTWCVRINGPLFISVFNPLLLVLVAIAGCLLLAEKLHLGSLLGAVLIVCGLYIVLWGKGKEMKKIAAEKISKESKDIEVVVTSSAAESDKNITDAGNINGVAAKYTSVQETEEKIQ